jgi:glutamine---fructose-6-phosphate transaminase (isomerizing)
MATTALLRMINLQAGALEDMCGLDLSAPAEALRSARRVIVTGTGTSLHAAELGAMMLSEAGLDARACPAATWARWSPGPRSSDVVCVITHTGKTAYAARARADTLAAGAGLVSITGTGAGWPEAIQTVANDESHTYTVSYTSTLAVLARLAQETGWEHGTPGQLAQAAAEVRQVCDEPPADVPVPARSLAIAGCGPWGITAREGALKIREASRTLAEGFDTDRLLHGGAVPYSASDGLVLLEPGADPDGLTGALGAAAAREGLQVTALQAVTTDREHPLPPLLAQIPMVVQLQLVAERFARLRHQDPDTAVVGAWNEDSLWEMGFPNEPTGRADVP